MRTFITAILCIGAVFFRFVDDIPTMILAGLLAIAIAVSE